MNLKEITENLKDCRKELIWGHISFSREPMNIIVKTNSITYLCLRIVIYSVSMTLVLNDYKRVEVEYKDIIEVD